MRKRIIDEQGVQEATESDHLWLNLESVAQVEISSEDEAHPIESALAADSDSFWRAAESGEQTLRLLFDEPQRIKLIRLLFQEDQQERTQEFVLRWSSDGGASYYDIARQQYNFSSPDSNRELEEFTVNLDDVTALELSIIPDISGGSAHATLARWSVA